MVVYSFVLSWTVVCFGAVVLAFLLYIMMCSVLAFCIFCMLLIWRGMSVGVLGRMFLRISSMDFVFVECFDCVFFVYLYGHRRLCSSLYCSILEFLVDWLVPFLYSGHSLVLVGGFLFLIGVPFGCLNFSYSK